MEFPVVVATDGHSSRTGEETDKATDPYELRQWLSMSDTSNWSQMWDQLFAGFHSEYGRILSTLQACEKTGKTPRMLPLNSGTVLQILSLMYGQWGPRWASVGMIMSAWKRVGVG